MKHTRDTPNKKKKKDQENYEVILLLGLHMIGNLNLLICSLVSYIHRRRIWGKLTTCWGLPLAAKSLQLRVIILCYSQVSTVLSFGEVFGRSRHLLALLSSYGQQRLIEFSRWILLERGASL
jgi:hypothetical protein